MKSIQGRTLVRSEIREYFWILIPYLDNGDGKGLLPERHKDRGVVDPEDLHVPERGEQVH